MADEQYGALLEIHRRWIGYVQPVGLVVAPVALVCQGIGADRNVAATQVRLAEHIVTARDQPPRIADLQAFLQDLLGWQADDIVPAPDDLAVPLLELGTTLRPTFAVRDPALATDASPRQMLIGVEPDFTDLDANGTTGQGNDARAWAAAPQVRFERLLRATEIPVGLLTNGAEFRLVYAPRGEASGHAGAVETWPRGVVLFVVEGDLVIDGTTHRAGTWLRLPPGSLLTLAGQGGALLYRKTGHLG